MGKLERVMADIGYIYNVLMDYRNILSTGDCNTCVGKCGDCKPKPGCMVRYNCPHYLAKTEEGEQDE